MLRIRACHVHGQFVAERQPHGRPSRRRGDRGAAARHRAASCCRRRPTCTSRKRSRPLAGGGALHRGERPQRVLRRQRRRRSASSCRAACYNTLLRALERLGLADVYGRSQIPLYVMNVAYPVVDGRGDALLRRQARGAAGRRRPAQLHRAERSRRILRQADLQTTRCTARTCWPPAGEYTGGRGAEGHARVSRALRPRRSRAGPGRVPRPKVHPRSPQEPSPLADSVHGAPAGLLHRLPRAADLQRDEAGRARARPAPRQRRHRLPPVLDPAAVPHRQHDDGLRPGHGAGASAFNAGAPASARSR